ncbi:hypothetical protein PMG11_04368 [Penicillium brasilianum]|uniref:Protein kinase domain-containing protein n=1 Tax=Penicillium brasilianum TaxID=104259 RepID=A0A0F7VFY0_PENBI|nr:hypothetical protein PMG11_04368 [Penicillium brasilianum]
MSFPESRPCTTFPRSENLRPPDKQINPGSQMQNVLGQPERSSDHSQNSDLNLRQSNKTDGDNHATYKRAADSDNARNKRHVTQFLKESSPWTSYKRFAALGPSETTLLAVAWNPITSIVAVKEHRVLDAKSLRELIPTSHVNIVKLKDAYYWSGRCFLGYERMHISLEQLCACNTIEDIHIATICRETLSGLLYICNELKASYTTTLYDNIFLTDTGIVKIGNVGRSMISTPSAKQEGQNDAVGKLILRMAQPGVTFKNPDEYKLRYPERWSKDLVEFHRATGAVSVTDLHKGL